MSLDRPDRYIAFAFAIGCSSAGDGPSRAPDLATLLADRPNDIVKWRLDEAAWRRITVEPYRGLHAEYVLQFDGAKLAAEFGGTGVAIRDHFADDPKLTIGQARTRWALPVMAAAKVATIDERPIDAVFVEDGGRWYAIVGLDRVVTAHVARLDPACATRIDTPSPSQRCRNVSWQVVDAALRNDRERFTHACSLAATPCGISSP